MVTSGWNLWSGQTGLLRSTLVDRGWMKHDEKKGAAVISGEVTVELLMFLVSCSL